MMVRAWEVLRGFNRDTRIFLLICALDGFGYFGIQNVLFNLYLLRLGFGLEFIGLLIASGQLIWAIAALPAGLTGQRLGIRTTMMLAFVLAALGMGAVLLVETLPPSLRIPWLLACWAVLWVGTALYSVNSPPYLMQVTSPETRSYAFAAQGIVLAFMGFGGSFVAGLLPGVVVAGIGGSLEQAAPYRFALWAAPAAYLLCALLWAGTRPVQVVQPAVEAPAAPKPLGLFVFLVLLVFLQTASEGALLSFFTVYLDTQLGVSTERIGAIVGIGQLLSVAGVLAVPHLLLRSGAPLTLKWTTVGIGLAMVPLALLPQWLPAAIGFASVSALSAINGPVRNVLSQELVVPQWRSTTSAMLAIGLALGWASAAAIGGYLIAQAGFDKLFLISAGLALGAVLLLWAYPRDSIVRS
jgi:MFS family permease